MLGLPKVLMLWLRVYGGLGVDPDKMEPIVPGSDPMVNYTFGWMGIRVWAQLDRGPDMNCSLTGPKELGPGLDMIIYRT